jgi:hypothetical protein
MQILALWSFGLALLFGALPTAAQCTMEGNLGRWPSQIAIVPAPAGDGTSVELTLGPGPYFTLLREAVVRTGSVIRVSGIPYYFGDIGIPPGYSGPHRTALGVLPPGEYTLVVDLDGIDCTDIVRAFRVGPSPAEVPIPMGRSSAAAMTVLLLFSGLLMLHRQGWATDRRVRPSASRRA